MLQQTDVLRITALTNDIKKLNEFVEQLKTQREKKIKALYIVTAENYQIELKGNFSDEASQKLLDLIIESRTSLMLKLEHVINDCIELVTIDKRIEEKRSEVIAND